MGRTRGFDEDNVLDRAMEVFWRLGYDGASVAELTKAMGLTSPSIYAAFGSKRGLFEAVLGRYRHRRTAFRDWVFAGPTARDVAERLLLGAADWLVDPNEPLGCLSVQAGVSAGIGNQDIPKRLAETRGRLESAMRQRFTQAKADGDLGPDSDPVSLARFVQTVFLGMSLQAASGSTRADLVDIARHALLAWPPAPVRRKSARSNALRQAGPRAG